MKTLFMTVQSFYSLKTNGSLDYLIVHLKKMNEFDCFCIDKMTE